MSVQRYLFYFGYFVILSCGNFGIVCGLKQNISNLVTLKFFENTNYSGKYVRLG